MDGLKQREKTFHDEYYSKGGREKACKFNELRITSNKYFESRLMELCRGKKVLEIGCSEGGLSSRLASVAAGVVGIDISEVAVGNARKRVEEKTLSTITFKVMDAENLAFEDNTFDVIYGGSILHHLDIKKTYKEIARVLKPDGAAVFSEPLGHNPFINAYRKLTPNMRTQDEHPLLMSDITASKHYFDDVHVRYFYLFSLCAAPFHKSPVFRIVLSCFEKLDKVVFTFLPFIKRYAWTAVITFSKPRVLQNMTD